MRSVFAITLVWVMLAATGCTWQANNGSDAVEINPLKYGTGNPIVQLSNAPGYMNGQAFDMRPK